MEAVGPGGGSAINRVDINDFAFQMDHLQRVLERVLERTKHYPIP